MPNTFEETREEPALSLPSSPTRPRRGPHVRPNVAIVEAVCCNLLDRLTADPPHPLQYYLALRGGDPEAALLRRLQTVVPTIAPRSQCRVSTHAGVTDRVTGAPGVIIEVTNVTWRQAGAVDVIGGYYVTPWHAAAFRYRVVENGGRWRIAAARELWRVSPVR